jgi:hypothetical protein
MLEVNLKGIEALFRLKKDVSYGDWWATRRRCRQIWNCWHNIVFSGNLRYKINTSNIIVLVCSDKQKTTAILFTPLHAAT